MPIKRKTILIIGIFFILLAILDIVMYLTVNSYGIQYLRILLIGLAILGGLGFIMKQKIGWILCEIYAIEFVIVAVYNLLINYPLSGLIELGPQAFFGVIITFLTLIGLLISVFVHLNKHRIRESYRIRRTAQQLSIGLGIGLAITNILI